MNEGFGDMVNQITALAPPGRQGEPEELAAAIVFLASDGASYIHGITLPVDSGRTAT
jgi:NAD(P)-dependent dehydrogenase (short-subunit alcohol dehydrogenase family)